MPAKIEDVVGVPTQSSKGLRVSTRCRDVEEFVRAFHRYCEDSGVFISHARRSVGEVVAFSFDLADGSAALSGLGAVVEQFATADNRFGRVGVVIAFHRLSRSTRRVFNDLTAARAATQGRRDQTPMPVIEARAFTSNIQMIDPEGLTPFPQPPPRPVDASPPPAEPVIAAPATTEEPLRYSRTATRSIAAIEIRPPATRRPPVDDAAAAPSAVVEAPPEAVVAPASAVLEPTDAIAEQTARMSSPPVEDLVPRTPDAPVIESETAAGSGSYEAPPLSPAPLELLSRPPTPRVAEGTPPPDTYVPTSAPTPTFAPALVEVATAHVDPVPVPAPSRWTKRRIWAVGVLAGASLLALGIVIGATFVGGGTRGASPSSQAAPLPTPPAAATPTVATPVPAQPPAPPVAAPTATAAPVTTPAAAAVTVAAPPAPVATKRPSRPKTPPKKPPAHAIRHKHAAPARCTSLNCL